MLLFCLLCGDCKERGVVGTVVAAAGVAVAGVVGVAAVAAVAALAVFPVAAGVPLVAAERPGVGKNQEREYEKQKLFFHDSCDINHL